MSFKVRNLKDFGRYLECIRLSLGLYQYQMAEKIGMDKANYNKLTKGKLNISLNKMISILYKIDSFVGIDDDLPF